MNSDRLREILEGLDVEWFFKPDIGFYARDLLELPPKYTKRIEAFISSHKKEELSELEPQDLIEKSTGEDLSKIAKMIKVAKKKQSLEQDFL